MARDALCVVLCAVYCILASDLLKVSALKFPSPYLPSSHVPPLILSIAPVLTPSSARFPSPLSLAPSLPTFLPHSFPSSTLPLHSRSHPSSHHRFLTPSPCSFPPHPPVAPSLPSSILPRSFPASLPACLTSAVQFHVHRMCVWQAALYFVAPNHA